MRKHTHRRRKDLCERCGPVMLLWRQMNELWDTNCYQVYSKHFEPACYYAVGCLPACVYLRAFAGPVSMGRMFQLAQCVSLRCLNGICPYTCDTLQGRFAFCLIESSFLVFLFPDSKIISAHVKKKIQTVPKAQAQTLGSHTRDHHSWHLGNLPTLSFLHTPANLELHLPTPFMIQSECRYCSVNCFLTLCHALISLSISMTLP